MTQSSNIKLRALLPISIILLTAFLFVAVMAQENDAPDTLPLGPTPTPGGGWEGEIFVRPEPSQNRSLNSVLDLGSDSCADAGELSLTYDGFIVEGVGDQTQNIGSFTSELAPSMPEDPPLACLGGTARPQGYRSVWYKITAPVSGMLTVETVTDSDYKRNYDTVIGIFIDQSAGACTTLTPVTCNDDHDAFLSKVTFRAEAGQEYLIEVVDRNIAASGPIFLNLEVSMEPDSGWENVGTGMPHRVSRHAVVMDGTDAYVIAGQNVLQPSIKRLGQMWKYETDTETWTLLRDMPANESIDGRGYSATDAALIGDKIHMISGYVGSADSYAGDHWVYDIPTNLWSVKTDTPINWNDAAGMNGPVGYSELSEFTEASSVGFYLSGGLAGQPLSGGDPNKVRVSAEVRKYVEQGGTSSWLTRPDMTTPRYAHTSAVIGSSLCVAGGLTVGTNAAGDAADQIVQVVECFNEFGGTNTWRVMEPMNTARYYAGSAVGPDGTWYVYGGRDIDQNYVNTVEAINLLDPNAKWQVLDVSFNIDDPAFAWLRGGFIDERLYLFGGDIPNDLPTGVVQNHDFSKLSILPITATLGVTTPFNIYMPQIAGENAAPPTAPASAPLGAPEVFVGSHVIDNFEGPSDAYDVYQFNPTTSVSVMFDLDVPDDADYDLILYDENKNLIVVGNNVGRLGEWLYAQLPAGRYYLVIARVAPPPSLPPVGEKYELFVTNFTP